ncbi:TIGR03016 family PEP-CTERM system-associated outer membrane protein [Pseudothauera nasutitermitis]|nr:TIGR03016 family PEP-CTERM system-associated outer membrane protein [Pseudothauera nasutitermitis]
MATKPTRMRPERRPRARPLTALLALALGGPVLAQEARVEPTLQLGVTWSDNIDASSSNRRSGFVLEASPGLSLSRRGGRISGQLDMSLRNRIDTSDSGRGTTFLALNGRGEIEAVEDLLFVELDAMASRDNPSLFSGRGRGDSLSSARANEVRALGIAPRLELRFGDTEAMLRYQTRWMDGQGVLDRQQMERWNARAGNATAFGLFGWGVDYSRTDTAYGGSGRRDVSQEVSRATLFINVTPQFRARLIGGHESNDYATRRGESGSITGVGFDWRPSARTDVSATSEKRVFGRGHDLRVHHRRARSVWELGWSRDITSSLESFAGLGNDPLYRQIYDALAATVPDPLERERAVLQILSALGYNIAGLRDTVVASNHYLDKRLSAGVTLIGARNSLSLSLLRSDRERIGDLVMNNPLDDFSRFDRVRENTASLSFSHRLTPDTSLTAGLTRSHARGSGVAAENVRRTLYSLGLGTRLGPSVSSNLTLRRQQVSGTGRFTENAIVATLLMRF